MACLLAGPAAAQASGPWALLVQLLAVAWLGTLALLAFRPDPGVSPRSPFTAALVAAPVASALAVALPAAASIVLDDRPEDVDRAALPGAGPVERRDPPR